MGVYILRRFVSAVVTIFVISLISFAVIELPPGDFLTVYVSTLKQSGEAIDQATLEALRQRYGLDKPVYVRYVLWMKNLLRGDLGESFMWNKPVIDLIKERMGYTVLISILATLFTWSIGFLIGVYSGTHQYTLGDYLSTVLGYIGLATPNFLLALILIWAVYVSSGQLLVGLFSSEEMWFAPWSFSKLKDLLKHVWIPTIVIGISGMASLIRVLRANLLDEINKLYVMAARAKGVPERELVWKYPLRVAVIPFVSTAGWILPNIISGATIISIVMNLRTIGNLLYDALISQDMYLAGSIVFILSIFTVIGTLISDILLAWLDPRIRFE